MTQYANQLAERMVALDERRPWEHFSPAEAYAFGIPDVDNPFAAFFGQDPGVRYLHFDETRPRKEFGLEMSLTFLPSRKAPDRWRGPLRHAPARSAVDGSVLVFPVLPLVGNMRPARKREVIWALYVVSAFDKAWRAGDIAPGPRDASERVPILHLEGPPEDPTYRISTILLKLHGLPV